jgi:hypothetical protein
MIEANKEGLSVLKTEFASHDGFIFLYYYSHL